MAKKAKFLSEAHFSVNKVSKSVSNSSAQSTTQCGVCCSQPVDGSQQLLERIDQLKHNRLVWEVALLQYRYGLRISEILLIDKYSFAGPKTLVIRGLKGSKSRVIELSNEFVYITLWERADYQIGYVYSRWFFYREYKKVGITFLTPVGLRNSVTHSLRINKIKTMSKAGVSVELIAQHIGHKSTKTTNLYVNKVGKQQ